MRPTSSSVSCVTSASGNMAVRVASGRGPRMLDCPATFSHPHPMKTLSYSGRRKGRTSPELNKRAAPSLYKSGHAARRTQPSEVAVMAKGLIIDDAYGRLARAYYQRFGTEPVSAGIGIAVERPDHIARTSLDTTLQAIIDVFGKRRDFPGTRSGHRQPRKRAWHDDAPVPGASDGFPLRGAQDLDGHFTLHSPDRPANLHDRGAGNHINRQDESGEGRGPQCGGIPRLHDWPTCWRIWRP